MPGSQTVQRSCGLGEVVRIDTCVVLSPTAVGHVQARSDVDRVGELARELEVDERDGKCRGKLDRGKFESELERGQSKRESADRRLRSRGKRDPCRNASASHCPRLGKVLGKVASRNSTRKARR